MDVDDKQHQVGVLSTRILEGRSNKAPDPSCGYVEASCVRVEEIREILAKDF